MSIADPGGGAIAYRIQGLDVLYCLQCHPSAGTSVPAASDDLPDGGICANCDRDVLLVARYSAEAPCGDRISQWVCTLPEGPHPDWEHYDGTAAVWWSQSRLAPYSNRDR